MIDDKVCYFYCRKGKIILGYEIVIWVVWKGEVKDGSGIFLVIVMGSLEFFYVVDENVDDDLELKVFVKDELFVG